MNLLVSFALTVTVMIANCREVEIVHDQTVGCLFDLCVNKPERALKARAAYICKNCTGALGAFGVSSIDLDAICAVLDRARLFGAWQGAAIQCTVDLGITRRSSSRSIGYAERPQRATSP